MTWLLKDTLDMLMMLIDAYARMYHAENFFHIARSHFENRQRQGSVQILLRIHGMSPANRPLGRRNYIIDYPSMDLGGQRSLTRQPYKCTYNVAEWNDDETMPVMRVIVSYVGNMKGNPFLSIKFYVKSTMVPRSTRNGQL